MSKPTTPVKRNPSKKNKTANKSLKAVHEDNNNTSKATERLHARQFASWYKQMVDDQRNNLGLYLTDDAVLEWFGRTIRTRKKVSTFLKFDMQSSRHDFTTVESIERIVTRHDRIDRNSRSLDGSLGSPLHSPVNFKARPESDILSNIRKRPAVRSGCGSPEWDKNCQPKDEEGSECKRKKPNTDEIIPRDNDNDSKREFETTGISHNLNLNTNREGSEINSMGDGVVVRKLKRKNTQVTPPNCEVGQGDGLPSTSAERSHEALNAQLPKKAVECNGYIEFVRTRNNRSTDAMKWERKCKLQVSYSQDPLNVGEYIIWAIHYTDESKCRRNLLAAFDEVSAEKLTKKS